MQAKSFFVCQFKQNYLWNLWWNGNRVLYVNDIWNKSYMNCRNEIKWRRDRRSELNLCNCVKKPEKNSGTHNWPAPNISGFIAQLVEHRTGIARSRVQTPLKSWIFFSGFFMQLHRLCSLRRSFLHFIFRVSYLVECIKCKHCVFWCIIYLTKDV